VAGALRTIVIPGAGVADVVDCPAGTVVLCPLEDVVCPADVVVAPLDVVVCETGVVVCVLGSVVV
jgi:hypothetical protein